MSTSFSEYLFDKDYIQSRSKLRSKDSSTRLMYVENEKDQSFWNKLLGRELQELYEFSMANGPGCNESNVRGKFRFDRYLDKANSHAVFALDSDFDHVLPNASSRYQHFSENPFVIHTFGYNKESLTNCIANIICCLKSFCYTVPSDKDIEAFLSSYSSIIKLYLVKYVFLVNEGEAPYEDDDFHRFIIPNVDFIRKVFHDNDWEQFKESIDLAEASLDQIVAERDLDNIDKLFRSHGMTEYNAYMFINGHKVQQLVVDTIIAEVKKELIDKAIDKAKQDGFRGSPLGQKAQEIKNHFSEECNFNTLRNSSHCLVKDDLIKKVQEQFASLIEAD